MTSKTRAKILQLKLCNSCLFRSEFEHKFYHNNQVFYYCFCHCFGCCEVGVTSCRFFSPRYYRSRSLRLRRGTGYYCPPTGGKVTRPT